MNTLRTLIMQHLDPAYFDLDEQQVLYWIAELPVIKEQIIKSMQEEMLGATPNSLVERHLKQIQYDCGYLTEALFKYQKVPVACMELYAAAGDCLEQLLEHIDARYAGFFNWEKEAVASLPKLESNPRIRVLFSVDALAYFFKLMNKAGGLDAGPVTQLILAISKNFITPGIGDGYISPNSLTTKYKQVVQSTAMRVRVLLVRMLKLLDEEFN
ncbi:hypothetical protein [Pedobacter nutrimenti]|uniref:hypothetical protein n=1 Tax=Pedobacter nutrimenti TaxID=1241337 RepID=UPI00292ED2B7|nr:hypothetical protein [Pedobacter nutrimenti]